VKFGRAHNRVVHSSHFWLLLRSSFPLLFGVPIIFRPFFFPFSI
jgi:hypothetical protein